MALAAARAEHGDRRLGYLSHVDVAQDMVKFKELVLYISHRSSDDPGFGQVKLNKLLFFCDTMAFAHLGQPITGVRYQKQRLGPTARALPPVLNELLRDEEIVMVQRPYFTKTQRAVVPRRRARLDRFTGDEIALVEEVLGALHGKDASEVSYLSHALVGWKLAEIGEDIPYEAALLSDDPPSDEQVARGVELAERFNWP